MKWALAICFGGAMVHNALADTPLPEVVVTAQFREEKLQDTPIAMSALDAAQITNRNILRVPDIADSVPNVILQNGDSGSGKSTLAFIRGVGQADYNYTVEPGVGIYIDDVYHSTLFGTDFDLLDLERVEVLRGPQGTLFGKNSIGGAVRLLSRKPQGDGRARLELTGGNLGTREARGMFDVPLVANTLALRVAASYRQRDGYVDQLDFACVHPDLGGVVNQGAPLLPLLSAQRQPGSDCKLRTLGNEDVRSVRSALRWQVNDAVEVNFIADWSDDRARAAAQTLISLDPNLEARAVGAFNGIVAIPLYGIPYDGRFLTGSRDSTFASLNALAHVGPGTAFPSAAVTGITSLPNSNTLEAYGLSTDVQWKIADALRFESITAYRGYSGTFSDDVDASPINQTFQSNVLDHHQFSEELRLHGVARSGTLDWTTGLFYFDAGSVNRGPVDLSVLSWVIPNLDILQDDSSNVRNESAFVDGTWHATQRLSFTAGVRYTHELKDYTFRHLSFVPEVPSLVPPTKTEVSYGRVDPRVVVDYRWLPELMTYVSFSTGFRAGGFNGRPFNSEQVVAFGPERLLSYEIGLKSEWLDRRVRLNAAAFFSDYRDLQLSILTVDATGQPFSAPANIGRAHITGGEVELEAQPVSALRLAASFGFQQFEATALGAAINCNDVADPVPTPAPGGNCTIGGASLGKPVPFIPRKTASAVAEYSAPLARRASLLFAANLSYESVSYTDAVASPEGAVPSRVLLNGRIVWRAPEARWVVTLSGTNLTDRHYYINKRNLIGLWGQVLGQPGRPREWGVSVAREFGERAD